MYPSIHPYIHPSSYISSIHPSINPSIYPFTHISTHPFIYLSIHPPIYVSIHSSIYLSIHPSIIHLFQLATHQSTHPSRHAPMAVVHRLEGLYPLRGQMTTSGDFLAVIVMGAGAAPGVRWGEPRATPPHPTQGPRRLPSGTCPAPDASGAEAEEP